MYNLIIGVDSLGQKHTPIVFKYTSSEESYNQWVESNFAFSHFTGIIAQYRFTDFFESDIFSKGNCTEYDSNGDPNPCYVSDIINGNIQNGSGGGASSGGSGPGSSGSCTYNSYHVQCGGPNSNTDHPPGPGGSGTCNDAGSGFSGTGWVLEVTCPNGNNSVYNKTAKGDCEDCESGPTGGVAINVITKKSYLISKGIRNLHLDPCPSGILSELKNLKQNNIAMIISRFGTPKSVYNWELISTLPSENINKADTKRRVGIDSYDYVTKIDSIYTTKATKISIARTILHEMLHAYMLSHIDDVKDGNISDVLSFPTLWQKLRSINAIPGSSLSAQHDQMAQKFIEPLKEALKEWHKNDKRSDEYYEDMAWGALIDTDTFEHYYPKDSKSYKRVLNRNAAEDEGSNSNGVFPLGKKCK